MNSNRPPVIATWLLKHFGSSKRTDQILGDLAEQYRRGRSRAWYWKQVSIAIVVGTSSDIWNNKLRAFGVLALGWITLHAFVSFVIFPVWTAGTYKFIVRNLAGREILGWYTPTILHVAISVLMLPVFAFAGWLVAKLSRPHRGMVITFAATCAFLRVTSFWSLFYESLLARDPRYAIVFTSYVLTDLMIAFIVLLSGGLFTSRTQRND